jgi:hypothetical protein
MIRQEDYEDLQDEYKLTKWILFIVAIVAVVLFISFNNTDQYFHHFANDTCEHVFRAPLKEITINGDVICQRPNIPASSPWIRMAP